MSKKPIFIIDDDELFADCLKSTIKKSLPSKDFEIKTFKNAISAMSAISDPLPVLIFLDVLLPGPDGFTFLNELVSYVDTAKIPIVLVSSLKLSKFNLKDYGVRGILEKDKMKPEEVATYVKRYTN